VVTATLNLTNTGNFTDTFALNYSGNQWEVQGPLGVTLAAWSDIPLSVAVHVPLSTSPGLSDTVHITATGTGDFAVSDLTTMVIRPYLLLLPLIRK
jgi:hypothetical protein